MSDKSNRVIISRRTRPAKVALSLESIVATALEVLERDGLSGLSLRRVATTLDTGAASLYVYIANLDELYALMLDQALAGVRLPDDDGQDWRNRVKQYLHAYLEVLRARRGLGNLALSTIAAGPNSLRMWEVLLGLLKEGGIDEARLVWSVDMLLLHVTSVAAEEANQHDVGQDFGRVQKALSAVSGSEFPLVSALHRKGLFSGADDDDAPFRWALDVIIDGIAADRDD